MYQSCVAIKIEEYVPAITPARSGNANSLIDETPRMRSIRTVIAVVIEVEIPVFYNLPVELPLSETVIIAVISTGKSFNPLKR